jgi:GNAT superfamily N-acetyltransferase
MQGSHAIAVTDYFGLCALAEADPANGEIFSWPSAPGRLHYLTYAEAIEETHFVALQGSLIVGVGSVRDASGAPSTSFLTQISVDPEHRKQGHARRILSRIFSECAARQQVIEPTGFSKLGWQAVAPTMAKLHQQQPDLLIRWNPDRLNALTDGHRPYRVEKNPRTQGVRVRYQR